MPRSQSKPTYSSSKTSHPSNTNHITIPKPTAPAVPATQTVVVEQQPRSIMSSIKDGFGWGIGTSIARSIFGGSSNQTNINTESTSTTIKCFTEIENYRKCTEKYSSDFCQTELDFLNKCKETLN